MNGGKRGEAGGKSQEKVQVTLFFFLETNSGWTRGDARQFTKSQALLSHFSKPHNLDTGPQLLQLLPHKPHSLTFANLVRKKGKGREKKNLDSSAADSYGWNVSENSSRKIKENGIASGAARLLLILTRHGCECWKTEDKVTRPSQ